MTCTFNTLRSYLNPALTLPMPPVLLVRTRLLSTTLAARYALQRPVRTTPKYALEPEGKASSFRWMSLSFLCRNCVVRRDTVTPSSSLRAAVTDVNYALGQDSKHNASIQQRNCFVRQESTPGAAGSLAPADKPLGRGVARAKNLAEFNHCIQLYVHAKKRARK